MKLAPLGWNYLSSGTVSTNVKSFMRGFPAANMFDTNVCKPTIFRGYWSVVAGQTDKIDLTDGGALVATLNAGSYYCAEELCIEVARALNAVSTNWYAYHIQEAATGNYLRFALVRTGGGTASLQLATGSPNYASNALLFLMGFRPQDRTASANHVGDLAQIHEAADGCEVDLGSAKAASIGFLVNVSGSPNTMCSVEIGASANPGEYAYLFGDHDPDVMCVAYDPIVARRYVRLEVSDPHRTDAPYVSVGYWYHGPHLDVDDATFFDRQNFEWGSYSRQPSREFGLVEGKGGSQHLSDKAPGEVFRVAFSGSPGVGPSGEGGLEDFAAALGTSGLFFCALDTDNEPHTETRLCRLVEAPTFRRLASGTKLGRVSVELACEVVALR